MPLAPANPAVDEEDDQPPLPKPRIGTTGGVIPEQQSEIDARTPIKWDADPMVRQTQVKEQITQRRNQRFQAEHPFTPSSFQPKPPVDSMGAEIPGHEERVLARDAEDQFQYQQQTARANEIERRRGLVADRNAKNNELEAQYRGSGQQFYTDADGRIQPVIETGSGRALFHKTGWQVGTHPETGKPTLEMRDQYGQRQYKAPPVVASLDPSDDQMYYKLPDGTMAPAGSIDEFAKHPNYQIAKSALAAKTRQVKAVHQEALQPIRMLADQSVAQLEDAKVEIQGIDADIEKLSTQVADATGPDGAPTPRSEGLTASLQQLQARRDQLDAQVKPRGALAQKAARAKAGYAIASATAMREAFAAQQAEIAARVKAQGGDLETDPTYLANQRGLRSAEQILSSGEQAMGAAPQPLAPQATAAAPQAPATTDPLEQSEPFAAAQKGVKNIGSVKLAEFARRYGDGRGPVRPDDLIKLYKRSKDIDATLTNSDTTANQTLRDQLTKEKDYVESLAKQRFARLPEDQQKRVADVTRDASWWDTTKGAGKSAAEEAAVGGGGVLKGLAQVVDSIGPMGNMQTGQVDPAAARAFYESRANDTSKSKMDRIKGDPMYQLGNFIQESAREAYAKSPHENETAVAKALDAAAGAAGGFAPMVASGPLAPVTIGLQTAGNEMERIYDEQIKNGVDPERAAAFAQKRALASGAVQAALFEILPKPLQKLGNKYIVDKVAGQTLSKFFANRLAQGAEGAVLGGTTTAAGNVAAGRPVGEGVGEGAEGLALIQSVMPRAGGAPNKPKGGEPAPNPEPKTPLTPEQKAAEAEFQKQLADEPAPTPSTAAEAAQVFEPALKEKENTPPPAKSAKESAAAIADVHDTVEANNKVLSQQEAKAQSLVDKIQEATGKPRDEILATRNGRDAAEWSKELESEAMYHESPLTVDPERRSTELRADLKKLDSEWEAHKEMVASNADRLAKTPSDGEVHKATLEADRSRHQSLSERRDAIEQQLTEAERTRQSAKGGEDLNKDLAEKEGRGPPPEEPGGAPAKKPTAPKIPSGGSIQHDLDVATETNAQINQRHPKPGPGRDAAMTERRAAAKRVAKTLKPGDKVGDFTIENLNKDGTITSKGGGVGIDIADEIQAGEPITRAPENIVDRVSKMSPDEVRDWARNEAEGGPTGESDKLGIASIGDTKKIAAIKAAHAAAKTEFKKALETAGTATGRDAAKAENDVHALSAKVQFFSEAIAAAENTGSAVHSKEVQAAHGATDLLKGDNFERAWESGGKQAGSENQIVIKNGKVYKRNYNAGLEKAYPNHETKAAFDEHLALHNEIFPETALKLEGMSETKDGPAPVVSQAEIKGTEATKPEIDAFMAKKGFEPYSGSAYVNKESGLRVGDLKGDNVIKDTDGLLHVIDPIIKRISKSNEEKPNATKTGIPERELQHSRASQGPAVPENVGKVRGEESAETGRGDRAVGGKEDRSEKASSVSKEVVHEIVPPKDAAPVSAHIEEHTAETVEGDKINKNWTAFGKESGTLGVPRAEMPQIKSEHRGALVNFLQARGVKAKRVMVRPGDLKPTQAEFSPEKVDAARNFRGSERPILISGDGHVIDGHHQWMAELQGDPNTPMPAIKMDAPIDKVLAEMKEFPSTESAKGVAAKTATKEPSVSAPPATKRLSDRAIDALQKAIERNKDETKKFVGSELGLVYQRAERAALELAVLGVRAGREVADVIKLAVARFKAKFPDHTEDHLTKLEADIRTAIEGRPPEPEPGTAKSKVPESLREVGVPAKDIEYDVRAQNERMVDARSMIQKEGAEKAEQMISDRQLPADTRVAIGGVLLEKKMSELANAKPEDVAGLTREIQRITEATRSGVSTESGQGVAMHKKIYENLAVGSAMEYTKSVTKQRDVQLGGKETTDAAGEAAKIFNGTKDQAARDAAIEKLKEKYTTKPARRMLDQLKRIEVVKDLNKLGVLTREDMTNVAGNAIGIPGISAQKLKHIAQLANEVTNAKDHATKSRAELKLADTLHIYKGVNPLDLEASMLTLNILSGPSTQAANLEGNALNLITQLGTTAAVNPAKLGPIMKGLVEGIPVGWDQAKSIMMTGRGTKDFQDRTLGSSNALANVDYARDFSKLNQTVGNVLTTRARLIEKISRFMKAADAVFYYPAREAYARLVTTKLLEGNFKGEELKQKVSEALHSTPEAFEAARKQATLEGYSGVELGRRVSDIIEENRAKSDVGKQAVKESERFAAEATFNNEPVGLAGVIYRNLARTVKDADVGGVPVLKPWAMFLRVPANVFNATTNFTPMGASRAFFGMKGEKYRKGGTGENQWRNFTKDERAKLYLQSVIGTTLMAGLTARILSKDDVNISASGPGDPSKLAQLKASGWNPYSIKVGNRWVSYKDSPLLVPLAIVGHVADAVRYQKSKTDLVLGSRVADAISHAPQIIFQTSMLSGLSDLMSAMGGQGDVMKSLERTLGSIPANLAIPYNRLFQQVDQTMDPKVYKENPVVDAVPFARREGEVQTDVQGRPRTYQPMTRFASEEKNDPVDTLLRQKNIFIPEAGKDSKIGNRVMTDDEYTKYRRLSGQRIRARLQSITPQLRIMNQEQAQKRVEQISREERAKIRPLIGSGIGSRN